MQLPPQLNSKVIKIARTLCNYVTTRYQSKKHGGYNIYEDDKIAILADTNVSNLDVYVTDEEGKRHLVLSRNYIGDNQVYHPGKWEGHILALGDLAEEAKAKALEEAESQKLEEQNRRFSPVAPELDAVFENKVSKYILEGIKGSNLKKSFMSHAEPCWDFSLFEENLQGQDYELVITYDEEQADFYETCYSAPSEAQEAEWVETDTVPEAFKERAINIREAFLEVLRVAQTRNTADVGAADNGTAGEEDEEAIDKYYLLIMFCDTEPSKTGPYDTYEDLLEAARAHRANDVEAEDGLYTMFVNSAGEPVVDSFSGAALEISEEDQSGDMDL